MINKIPKLTLEIAKALALQELGTAKGLTASENKNADFQSYIMILDDHVVSISGIFDYLGVACLRFGDKKTYFDINTLQENVSITERFNERDKKRRELIEDMAYCYSGYMFEALVERLGVETCRRMIDETAKKLCGTR